MATQPSSTVSLSLLMAPSVPLEARSDSNLLECSLPLFVAGCIIYSCERVVCACVQAFVRVCLCCVCAFTHTHKVHTHTHTFKHTLTRTRTHTHTHTHTHKHTHTQDGNAMLWDLNEAKHLYTLTGGDVINSLVFSPNRYIPLQPNQPLTLAMVFVELNV